MKNILKFLIIFFICEFTLILNVDADDLPKIYLEGNIENMLKKSDIRDIKLIYNSDELNFDAYAEIKIQGGSSIVYDKKNYTIKLYKDKYHKSKKKVDIGFGEENKYCLKANWIDKTHSRNIVSARIMSDIQKKYNLFMDTPNNGLIDGFPIEVYINNEFLGLYTLNIAKDEEMFNMDNENINHMAFFAVSYYESNKFKEYANYDEWELEVGVENQENLDKFNRMMDFVINSTDEEFRENFDDYLNFDATLNYYVMLEIGYLLDNISKNMFMVSYDGMVWYPSLYDMDTSWGVNWNGKSLYDYDENIDEFLKENLLWEKFGRVFKNEIANRYFELRKDILTKDNIIKEFENFYKKIPNEIILLENEKWGDNIPGYSLDQIKEFLDVRIPLVDDKMYNMYNLDSSIDVIYSNKKKTFNPINLRFILNRNDLRIFYNNKEVDGYNFEITENGKYTFEYRDWYGNIVGFDTIEVDCILSRDLFIFLNVIGVFLFSVIFVVVFYKKIKKSKKRV